MCLFSRDLPLKMFLQAVFIGSSLPLPSLLTAARLVISNPSLRLLGGGSTDISSLKAGQRHLFFEIQTYSTVNPILLFKQSRERKK